MAAQAHTIDIDGTGKHHVLMHPYALSGRETSHPLDVRGWTTSNLNLLVEDDHALLFSTGYSIHQDALIAQLDQLSTHADCDEVLAWIRQLPKPPRRTFITHGEPAAADALRQKIERELGWTCHVPEHLESIRLD